MPRGPIRRAQLIAPYGVGSMVVDKNGVSIITAGLDHWFEREGLKEGAINESEFIIEEWRLQRLLGVNSFRMPPDFREKRKEEDATNTYLTVPFLRFPQWHFCPLCHNLYKLPLSKRDKAECSACSSKYKRKVFLSQAIFVAMCDHGHIQDFPWREWVHGSSNPTCNGQLSMVTVGGTSLAGQKVKCSCGASRSLARITEHEGDSTFLTNRLDKSGTHFLCRGAKPWLGYDYDDYEGCARPLKGSLRSAANVYYAHVHSAIYLTSSEDVNGELLALLEAPPLSTLINLLSDRKATPADLRNLYELQLQKFSDDEIQAALNAIFRSEKTGATAQLEVVGDDQKTSFRRLEYRAMRSPKKEAQLVIKEADLANYEVEVVRYFSKIMLVEKLRETRAMSGFARIYPENDLPQSQVRELLWRDHERATEWLPAYYVFGEGIFFEFNEGLLRAWEDKPEVIERASRLTNTYREVLGKRQLEERNIGPRFVLLHTFAHLVMNRMVFECGYSSASLRERIYCSENRQHPMAGVLIYTAAGDSEGTMGGLVRMGKPGSLEPVVSRAIEHAKWCSADPVCMEIGEGGGQGPDSCNLAACHNCALIPETSCEEFNRLLDRALVVGSLKNRDIGYFSSL